MQYAHGLEHILQGKISMKKFTSKLFSIGST